MTVVGRDSRSGLVLFGAGALLLAVAMWEAGLSAGAGQSTAGGLAGVALLDAGDSTLDGDAGFQPAHRHALALVPLPVALPHALPTAVPVRLFVPPSIVAARKPLRLAPKTSPPLRV